MVCEFVAMDNLSAFRVFNKGMVMLGFKHLMFNLMVGYSKTPLRHIHACQLFCFGRA